MASLQTKAAHQLKKSSQKDRTKRLPCLPTPSRRCPPRVKRLPYSQRGVVATHIFKMETPIFTSNISKWLQINLTTNRWMPQMSTLWTTLFGLIAWRLWKNLNSFIFSRISMEHNKNYPY